MKPGLDRVVGFVCKCAAARPQAKRSGMKAKRSGMKAKRSGMKGYRTASMGIDLGGGQQGLSSCAVDLVFISGLSSDDDDVYCVSARDYSSKPDGEHGRFNHWFCTKERKDCQVRPDLRGRLVYIVNICVASQSFHTNQPITQGCLSRAVLQPFGFRHQRSLLQIAHVHRLFQLGVCPRERGCHASCRNHCHQ